MDYLLYLFSFLDILRFSNLRIDVLVMMTSRFWGIIVVEFFLKFFELIFINEFNSSALYFVHYV